MANSTRFAIAVHALTALAYLEQEGVERVSSEQIAQSVNTNPVIIRGLLKSLKDAGLIECKEGKGGGICLAKKPSQISLMEIYSALESSEILSPHKNSPNPICPVSVSMKKIFLEVAKDVDTAVAQALQKKTLKNLIDRL